MRTFRTTSSGSGVWRVVEAGFWGIRSEGVASAAERMMKSPWMRKRVELQRRLEEGPDGVRNLETRKVRMAPMRKEARETRVVSQACGLEGRPAVERPSITVLPEMLLVGGLQHWGTDPRESRDSCHPDGVVRQLAIDVEG